MDQGLVLEYVSRAAFPWALWYRRFPTCLSSFLPVLSSSVPLLPPSHLLSLPLFLLFFLPFSPSLSHFTSSFHLAGFLSFFFFLGMFSVRLLQTRPCKLKTDVQADQSVYGFMTVGSLGSPALIGWERSASWGAGLHLGGFADFVADSILQPP